MATHRLLILSKHAAQYRDLVEAAALPNLVIESTTDRNQARKTCADCDLAFGDPSLLRDVVPHMPKLRWVQATWAGVEPLLDPSLPRSYVLTNARGVFGRLMSEYVFGYLLAHERKILQRYASQQAQRWDPTPPGTLRAKHIGLMGVGTIGASLARTAKHFGMRVSGFTRASETCPDVDLYYHGDGKLAFAADLDYLVTVVPGTVAARHLVDRALLEALPNHAVFVNPGRGNVVDEQALAAALVEGRIAAAVLDVFSEEPLPTHHVFWRTPNLIITSHTAALSVPQDIAPLFIENYKRFVRGEPVQYEVDFEQGY